MSTLTQEATMDYEKALHLGKKDGGSIEILDDILEEKNITVPKESSLGIVQIPTELIVGTKTDARSSAFTKNFYPTLGPDTEFGHKWISLCASHLEEGIREPIKAYEFMNKFYVVEGNKRVSVLKYFDAPAIAGQVIRIIPPYSEEKEVKIYYEYMDFYRLSSVNFIRFSKEGSYQKLQKLAGKHDGERWTKEERQKLSTVYYRFLDYYKKLDLGNCSIYPGDAFLYFISLYAYDTLKDMDSIKFRMNVEKLQDEFKLLGSDNSVKLHMDPADSPKKSLLRQLLPTGTPHLKVAFIHEKTAETSGWTYGHELGRTYLHQNFSGQVTTTCYDGATEENAAEILEKAIKDGNKLIFTTSPVLSKESLKAAIARPDIKILNCSLNATHKAMRTYYLRMYEIKFLLGVIAGSITEKDRIGYLVKYPTHGTASINAFALGAQMVNPRAKIYLLDERIAKEDENFFIKNDISIICGKDMSAIGLFDQRFGLYRTQADTIWNMAMPVWNWGKFYEQMIRNIMDGSWKKDDTTTETAGLNYWWGISADVLDIICSGLLPTGTLKLVQFLKESIGRNEFSPFSGVLHSQKGIVQHDPEYTLTPEEIITMDWLADNVVGTVSKTEDWNRGLVV